MKPALSLLLGLSLAAGPLVPAPAVTAAPATLAEARASAAGGHWREAAKMYEASAVGPASADTVRALVGAVDACGRLGAFERAEGLATRAIAAAEALGDDRARAQALTAQARLRAWQERFLDADALARRAMAAAERAGATAEAGHAAFCLGEALLQLDRWSEAAQALERSVSVARQADPATLGEQLQALALARYSMGDPAGALALCEEAVRADREAGPSGSLVERLSGLAVFHIIRGQRFDDARALLDEALALSRTLGRRDLEALARQRVAALETFSERHEAALRHQQAALALYRELGMETAVAQALSDIGDVYKAWDRPGEAKQALTEALAAETRLGRRFSQAMALRRLAELHLRAGEHAPAIARYEQALAIHQALGRTLWLALTHLAIGGARFAQYDYPGALAAYDAALLHAQRLGHEGLMASCYEGAASVHSNRGRYDQAVALAEKGLAIHRRLGQDNLASYSLQLIASAYEHWGQSARAIETYEAARALQLKLGNMARAAGCDEQIAAIEVGLGDHDKALARYQAAIAVYRRLNQRASLAKALKGAAYAHRMQGDTASALARYGEARALFAELKQPLDEASVLEATGVTHRRAGHPGEAMACLEAALGVARRHQDAFLAAGVLGEIGRTHQDARAYAPAVAAFEAAIAGFDKLDVPYLAAVFLNEMAYPLALQGRFSDAAKATRAAIDRIERLRATADGEARRDFLAKQVSFYEDLVVFSSYQEKPEPVYLAAEQGRARMLSETLAKGAPVAPPPLSAIRQGLPDGALVLSYTSTGGHQVQLAVDKAHSTVSRVQVAELFKPPVDTSPAAAPTAPRRGVAVVESDDAKPQDGLAGAIHRYRALLQSAAPADQALARRYGRALYDVLIRPQASRLTGKADLVIVPSAELAALPFETLIDEKDRYLAEGFRVRYAQSLTVWHQLRARRHASDRRPMLAVGGARYGKGATDDAGPMAPGAVRRWVSRALEDRVSLRPIYRALGLDGWADLPGTRDEVAAIAKAVPGATVLSGDAASEHGLKALPLERYRVIHLATHGLVVPGVPALSALVLSQFPTERGGEDGYLRMDEIASLKLRADFVNLSACETGLGTVYGGEGVVGLAQAVLVAGANGVSVSLWQVADDSTARLMAALYEAVQRDGLGHAEALARIKRRFIRGEFGEAYRSPYHWAPFVYYGL